MGDDKHDNEIVKIGNNDIIRYSNTLVRRGIEEINEKLSQANVSLQVNAIGIQWVFVEGGPTGDFYISATTVTFEQYDKFCDATGYEKPFARFGRGEMPVVFVNVGDALAYCDWLSKETGTTIRLPEEDEWEFAAKGGNKSKEYKYSGSNNIDEVAWYESNSKKKTHIVATKKSNELGIYDMSGNVWEWCGTKGAARGGSWGRHDLIFCQVSSRYDYTPDLRFISQGFRILQKR